MSVPSLFSRSPCTLAAVAVLAWSGGAALAQSKQFVDALQSVTEQKEPQPSSTSKSYSDAAGVHAKAQRAATVLNTTPVARASGNYLLKSAAESGDRDDALQRNTRSLATAPGGLEALKVVRPADAADNDVAGPAK